MAYNYNIDKAKPPDTGESPSLGARVIRYFKEAVIERLQNLVHGFGSDAETDEGFKKVPLVTRSAPAQEANKAILYAKDVSGIAELFVRDENGVEMQITTNGKINGALVDADKVDGKDIPNTIANILTNHTKAIHDALGINAATTDGRSLPNTIAQLLTNHNATAHPVSVLKLSTGSYSQDIFKASRGSAFSPSKYSHNLEVKGENSEVVFGGGPAWHYSYEVTTSWVARSFFFWNRSTSTYRYAYAQWSYHSASKQAIWGIWDNDKKKLVCVLVEEDEGYCKLHPELKLNEKLIKFKDPDKFLNEDFDSEKDKVKDKKEKEGKIKEKAFAGYILEHAKVKDEDIEEIV